jgi:ABC-type transporter Mla maintaining outer membrane lipid asymmetry ATPase subunit MlaF
VSTGGNGDVGARLRVEGLGMRFGGLEAVSGVDLDITPGKITAIIGPNSTCGVWLRLQTTPNPHTPKPQVCLNHEGIWHEAHEGCSGARVMLRSGRHSHSGRHTW